MSIYEMDQRLVTPKLKLPFIPTVFY